MSTFSNAKVLRWEVIRRHGGFLGSNNLVRAIADRFADIGFPLTEEDRPKIDEFIKVFNGKFKVLRNNLERKKMRLTQAANLCSWSMGRR
jgi:hypothetical protein